jgi:hypothetical protein
MSTATTTESPTGQHTTRQSTTQPTNTPTTQLERSAANRLRTTMAAVRLAFTWQGVRKTLAPEQRTTAARAIHADRELLSASKLILDTKNPAYRAVAAVRSEASCYWRTVTLPFPEAGIRLLPQNSLGLFANTMAGYRERLQESVRDLAAQYDQMKSEAQRRTTCTGRCLTSILRFSRSEIPRPFPSYRGRLSKRTKRAHRQDDRARRHHVREHRGGPPLMQLTPVARIPAAR